MDFRTIKKLSYFVTLAEELHFGRAAARLSISQPPLSQQIQALERELNVSLFDRSKRRVRLTGPGQALFVEAKRVLRDVENLSSLAKRAKERSVGVVRISCFTSAMFAPMPELLNRMRSQHPNIDVMIREAGTAEGFDLIQRKEIDLAIVRSNRLVPGIRSKQLIADKFCIAVQSTHKFANKRQISLSKMSDQDFVLFPRTANPEYYDSIISACMAAGFSPRVNNQGLTIISQLGFVASGLGVAIVPSSFGSLGFRNLSFIRLSENIPNHISAIYRDDEDGSKVVASLGL